MRSMRSLHWLGFCSGERVNISFMEGLRTLHETLSVFSICKKRPFIKWLTGPYNFYKTKQKHIIYGEIENPSWKPYQKYLKKLPKDRSEKNHKLTNWPPLVRTQSRLCHFLFPPSCTLFNITESSAAILNTSIAAILDTKKLKFREQCLAVLHIPQSGAAIFYRAI